jgi:lysozyme
VTVPYFSPNCIKLVKQFEGLDLTVYRDIAAIPTVGYGHVVKNTPLKVGDTITQAQADTYLNLDLMIANKALRTLTTNSLNQNQTDALTSFIFNLGQKTYANSTLLTFLNKGEFALAAEEFPKWDHSGGKVIPGLLRRRLAEQALFLNTVNANS